MAQMAAMFSVGLCFCQGALNLGQLHIRASSTQIILVLWGHSLKGQLQCLLRLSSPGAAPPTPTLELLLPLPHDVLQL